MLEVSKRINTLVELVEHKKVADIATDHCYIPIHLCNMKEVSKVIACDINKKPLEKGREHINKYNLQNIIETRLGNGLYPIKVGEVDTIIIGGIGGELMVEILKNSLEVVQSMKQLVLQPQSYQEEFRKFINSIGFKIDKEVVLKEHKFYTIFVCTKGEQICTKGEYITGINVDVNEDYKEYLEYNLNSCQKIKLQLQSLNNDNHIERINELEQLQMAYKEKLKCLK